METKGFRFSIDTKSGSGYRTNRIYYVEADSLVEAEEKLRTRVAWHCIIHMEVRPLFHDEEIIT